MKKLALTIASAALALSAFALPAQAADGVKVGTLTCSEQASWGFIVGSSRTLNCRFDSSNGGPTEWYTGHVSKFGLDIGHTKAGVLTWVVFAPASNVRPDRPRTCARIRARSLSVICRRILGIWIFQASVLLGCTVMRLS